MLRQPTCEATSASRGRLGFGATAARADDPTAVELVGNWFSELTTPLGVVPVELRIVATKNRRFAWVALENFGDGSVEVATGLGTISESGQGQIKGDGVPGNPAGLLRISAHGQVRGDPGSFTAHFDFHGMNLDGSMVDGTITLQQRNETGLRRTAGPRFPGGLHVSLTDSPA